MPDGLYERDVLAWSEQQAELLRRLSRGERVNNVDWANLVEEIEGVGLSELHAVESFLQLILAHLLKIHTWPDAPAVGHWLGEIVNFQTNAHRRFTPSMRQRIDINTLFDAARREVSAGERRVRKELLELGANPFTLDELLTAEPEDLLPRLTAPGTSAP